MKQHGIGVGYRYPHDFEGADVEQQYLPDELVEPALLPADRPGLRGDDRRPDGRPRRGRAAAKAAGKTPALEDPGPGGHPPRRRRPHEDPRDEPQEARRDREARRGLGVGRNLTRRVREVAILSVAIS